MSTEMLTALSGVAVSLVTAAGSVWVARSGRRTRQQERRDDFDAIKKALNEQITGLKSDLAEQKTEMGKQRRRISDQDAAIAWLLGRVRGLVWHIRRTGSEPPPAEPIPERVQEYIQHLDV